jgi:4-amino-4-deoxy-L-arabinose transferase-like glycosyltransferase
VLAGVAALVRLPFIGSIGPDEGGYAYVAWQWANGHALYRSVWVDRPQGLILVYRLLISIAHAAWAIRLGAVISGVAISLLLVAIGRIVASPTTGFVAGALYAVAGVGPHIEGYTFNGELAAAVPATAAVAAALVASARASRAWLGAAAMLGGSALLMKQSGFDGLAVVFAVALFGQERLRRTVLVACCAAIPVAASAIAGLLTGWHEYWTALVGDPLGAATATGRLAHLEQSLPAAASDLLPLVAAAVVGLCLSRKGPGRQRLAFVWLGSALVAVNIGGLYWPHYYVQLLAPLCLAAALALARMRTPAIAWATAALVSVPALAFLGNLVRASDYRADRMVKYTLGFENDERIAHYVRSHTTPQDSVYAFVSRADFYFLAERPAATPYIWAHPLNTIPGARSALARTLSAPQRPRLVVLFQRRPLHRQAKRIGAILDRGYEPVWRAPGTGTIVLARRSRAPLG